MFRKNTAGQFIHFQGVDSSTGGIKSAVTWTVRRCIDGTFAAATGTVTEDGTTGWYKFAMSQADTNGNNIGFNFTGTGAVPQTVNIVTTACDPTSTAFGLSLAKTTNITGFNDIAATAIVSAGAITTSGGAVSTVTTVTNQLTAAAIATGVWQDATAGDFTVASSIGKSLYTGNVAPGAAGGHFIAGTNAATSITTALTANITGTITTCTNLTNAPTNGDLTATMKTSVTTAATAATPTAAAVTGAVGSVTAGVTVTTNNDKAGYGLSAAAVQSIWDALTSALTTVGSIGKKLADWTIGTAQTGDAFARLGAPAGASVSADIAAAKADTAAIKTKTDSLTFTAAGKVDANVKAVNDTTINGAGTAGNPWGP